MMLAYARKHPANAKRLLDIMHSELREQDLKRVDRAKNELSLIVGNSELANASHNRAFFRKCVTAVWVKDKVQHDHRIQS